MRFSHHNDRQLLELIMAAIDDLNSNIANLTAAVAALDAAVQASKGNTTAIEAAAVLSIEWQEPSAQTFG